MDFNDHGHPIWRLLRLTVCMSALTAILWINASQFDHTELEVLVYFFLAAISCEAVGEVAKQFKLSRK